MSRIGKGGSRVRDFFRRIFHRNGHSQTFRSVDDLTADPNAAFHNAGLHSNGRNLSERAASSNDLLSQSPTPTTKDKPVNFKPEHDEYDWNHKRKPSPSRPRRSAHRKEHKKNPPAPPPRMKSKIASCSFCRLLS